MKKICVYKLLVRHRFFYNATSIYFFKKLQTDIDGARKLGFERMTPIRKGGEKTEVTVTRVQPNS